MGRMMNRLLQNAVMLGGVITAYQAAQTTKKETGGFAAGGDDELYPLRQQKLRILQMSIDGKVVVGSGGNPWQAGQGSEHTIGFEAKTADARKRT